MDSRILLNVEGMDCAHCAQTITRTLQKAGLNEVSVDYANGEVTFGLEPPEKIDRAVKDINGLGYHVIKRSDEIKEVVTETSDHENHLNKMYARLAICIVCTLPLLLSMFLPFGFLNAPYTQLILCLPVMFIGWIQFGKSAFYSVRAGVPNMDVLIVLGSTAAFFYSLIGMICFSANEGEHFLFFETAATIVTLVLLGNIIEKRSVSKTTTAIKELSRLQPRHAKRMIFSAGKELVEEVQITQLSSGDLLLVNSGDVIPLDGSIISGEALVDESLLTGESLPSKKSSGDKVTGGSILSEGNFTMTVEKTGNDTALAQIIRLVKDAQRAKPQIQKLGDKISAVFVPVVLFISIGTFFISHFAFSISISSSLMHSIAVLVISCPCAMGLATPTAVMVGIGKAARKGILIKGGNTLEELSKIKIIVFDKTGTLTTGKFRINNIHAIEKDEQYIKALLFSIEKHSSHPIAKSIREELGDTNFIYQFSWKKIEEDKGIGINATDNENNLFSIGSFQMVKHFYHDLEHTLYVLQNNKLIATVDMEDELKKDVAKTILELKKKGMKTVMISGDRKSMCERVAKRAGIEEFYAEKLPKEKLLLIEKFSSENPTAMFGDGINDAPALSKANIGISISNATDVAIQSSQVILLHKNDLSVLITAFDISAKTYQTIKQNLFWAFFYNVVAIPVACAGLLNPMIGALSMAFSDVIVIGNSLRLRKR